MLSILRNVCSGLIGPSKNIKTQAASFYILSKTDLQMTPQTTSNFLTPPRPDSILSCGLKVKGFLNRRCKDCYFVKREDRLYVMCKTHPRHKQVQMAKKPKNTWMLSHATQGQIRPW